MSPNHVEFSHRLCKIERRHDALSKGYVTRLRKDGLVVVEPRRPRTGFSWKPFFLLLGAVFIFKGFLLSNLGTETYAQHIERLQGGTVAEKAAAFVLHPEAVSRWVAAQVAPFR